ncbi:Signal recognition particle subunit SRP72, partial [Oleoguttula sp. CCFEE 5521]
TPDPERWLPLKDRSTYRPPKGKKGKGRRDMLAQGATGGDESKESSRPGTPGGEVVKGKAPAPAKKKGKKK